MSAAVSMRVTHFDATAERASYFAVTFTDALGKSATHQVPTEVFLRASKTALAPQLESSMSSCGSLIAEFNHSLAGAASEVAKARQVLERGLRKQFGITVAQAVNKTLEATISA